MLLDSLFRTGLYAPIDVVTLWCVGESAGALSAGKDPGMPVFLLKSLPAPVLGPFAPVPEPVCSLLSGTKSGCCEMLSILELLEWCRVIISALDVTLLPRECFLDTPPTDTPTTPVSVPPTDGRDRHVGPSGNSAAINEMKTMKLEGNRGNES